MNNTPEWLDALLRVVGDGNVVEIPPSLGYDDVSVFTRAFGGAYLNYGTQDTRLAGNVLTPMEGGRGLAFNHNPAFYADDDSLVTSLRMHIHVADDHLFGAAVPGQAP